MDSVSRPGPRAVACDLTDGTATIVSSAREAVEAFQSMIRVVLATGCPLPAAAPTATTLAAAREAARVRPGVGTWAGETDRPAGAVPLPLPAEEIGARLHEVLRVRRSVRRFSALSGRALSTLLYHAARTRWAWTADDGYPASSRAAPSAGARHPIDIVVVPGGPSDLYDCPLPGASGYLYDPARCCLTVLATADAGRYRNTMRWVASVLGSAPAVVLALAGRPERTLSRYRGGLSLLYRDAGALTATIGLVATGLGLRHCPVARAVPETDVAMADVGRWVDAGAIAVGGPPG